MTHTTTDAAEVRADTFRGDTLALIASIDALLSLDDAKALAPHPLGGAGSHAYRLLCAARHRLATAEAASGAGERERKALREALTAEDEYWQASRDLAAAFARIRPEKQAVFDAAASRRAKARADLASLPPATDPAIPDGWKLVPAGYPVTLNECPPGPFAFQGSLGFRSEYATTLEEPRRYQVDAYCFESGEYFWGGAKGTEARGKLIVQPLALAAAPTIPATGEAEPKPLRVDWNKHDLAEAYDLVEGVRSKMAQSSESPLDTSLRAALNAIEAADCEWDGLTKTTIPATGHAATEGEG